MPIKYVLVISFMFQGQGHTMVWKGQSQEKCEASLVELKSQLLAKPEEILYIRCDEQIIKEIDPGAEFLKPVIKPVIKPITKKAKPRKKSVSTRSLKGCAHKKYRVKNGKRIWRCVKWK